MTNIRRSQITEKTQESQERKDNHEIFITHEIADGLCRKLPVSHWRCFVLSAISSLTALVPFFYIWRIINQVLETAPHFENATRIAHDGWMALAFSILSMLIYIAASGAPTFAHSGYSEISAARSWNIF